MGALAHKLFNRSELQVLEESFPDSRLELIEGEIFDRVGQNPRHSSTVFRLMKILMDLCGVEMVRHEAPIEVTPGLDSRNLPVPDLCVTKMGQSAYRDQHPGPADLKLVIEVSDTSLAFDLDTKARLYAQSGIVEYWVADLNAQLVVHRDPGQGQYHSIRILEAHDVIASTVVPIPVSVAVIFAD